MLRNKINNKGFTIIEVLIVLVVAGVIMLIVFLAVPALQRNARNTAARSEASRLIAAATEWTNNNNGVVPNDASSDYSCGTTGTLVSCNTETNNAGQVWRMGNGKDMKDTFTLKNSGNTTAITAAFKQATIQSGRKCGSVSSATYTHTSAPSRAFIIVYATEDAAGSVVPQCIDS